MSLRSTNESCLNGSARRGRVITLAGIGPGGVEYLTEQARKAILSADSLIGAERMVLCGQMVLEREGRAAREVPLHCMYRPEEICACLSAHPEYRRPVVLLSGDIGFYSGAGQLSLEIRRWFPDAEVVQIPGISSVVCLAARLGVSWEDGALVSLHGREPEFIRRADRNRKTFLLLGGRNSGRYVLEQLREFGMDHVTLHCGVRLSYPDERILSGGIRELTEADLDGLSVMMIENPAPDTRLRPHIRDEELIRGNVPVTKEHIRALCIGKLELTEGAVLWDVGAGTGSVSVEAALSGDGIRVYAIEKNPEAVDLIRQNRIRFRAEGIRVVPGMAPEALYHLEPPTHLFIGGSSRCLREILFLAAERNPEVRIVITAITLETIRDVLEVVDEGLLKDPEILQVQAALSREAGRYHLMTGQNPVYIIAAGGRRRDE